MTSLADHTVSDTTKLIVVGDNGSGKTGALASLIKAGYKLWILDTDNGIDTLATIVRDAPDLGPQFLASVQFVTLNNAYRTIGDKLISQGDGWARLAKILKSWDGPAPAVGEKVTEWLYTLGPNDIFVVDSLSGIADIAMDQVLKQNGRLGAAPFQTDWRDGQDMIQNFLRACTATQFKANLIVNAHITYIKTEDETDRGYPSTLGRALSPKIGRHFNSVLHLKREGIGDRATRKFYTSPQGVVEVKNAAPFSVKKSYTLETGLADFFRDVRGQKNS